MHRLICQLRDAPERGAARENDRPLDGRYDAANRPIERLHLAAIDLLELGSGEAVYDVGCRTGAVLPELARRVGMGGRVIGIEQSLEMASGAVVMGRTDPPEESLDGAALPVHVPRPNDTVGAARGACGRFAFLEAFPPGDERPGSRPGAQRADCVSLHR